MRDKAWSHNVYIKAVPLMQSVHTISGDVSVEKVKEDLLMELSGLPPVDVLVNSAGVTHSGAFLETSPQTFEVSY